MDTEQEEYEDIEEEEIVSESTPRQPKKPTRQPKPKPKFSVEETPEVRYKAYRVQAQEGIMDTETNNPVGNEVYVILAEILNKLNNIEISQG